jgi:hypothetical protein
MFLALFAVLSFSVPDRVSAQGIYLGGGVTIPMGDYKEFSEDPEDGAKTGFMTFGGVSFPINQEGLSVYGEGFFGKNDHEYGGDSTNLYGAMGGVLYDFAEEGEPGVYVFGQLGLMVHDYKSDDFPEFEETETGLAFGGGAGFGFPLGGMSAWIEGRYMQGNFDVDNTMFLGGMAGISIPLGGS